MINIKNKKVAQALSLFSCFMVMATLAVVRDGRLFGVSVYRQIPKVVQRNVVSDTLQRLPDGMLVIRTLQLGKNITGYGGPVPLKIYIKDKRVVRIVAEKNQETPEFFHEACRLLSAWNGKKIDEAQRMKVDAVSGATFSSKAIIGNVEQGLAFAAKNAHENDIWELINLDIKTTAGLIVVLMASILPLFLHRKSYRTLQLVLNVAVLGFWCGTFISYALMIGYLANGVDIWASLIPIIMLITAFIYPLFGKKNYYCTNICPCGSLQELAGKVNKWYRWRMPTEVVQALNRFREILWALLLMLMLLDITSKWMDYEVFSAFIIQSASWIVLTLGIVFLLFSFFVPRPYCRFLCPTGTLFKIAQNSKF